jgi:hypothetical protein
MTSMAISKPKNSNLLDDLVLNLDPFIANGLEALDAPSAGVQGTPGAQASGGDETPGPQVTGVVPPATADPDIPEAPTVSLFRVEVPGTSAGLAATANAEGDAPPQVVGEPQPAAPDPGPQDPPPRIADPDFNEVAPEEPDAGPPPTVQEGAVSPSASAAPDPGSGNQDVSGIAGLQATDWWLA